MKIKKGFSLATTKENMDKDLAEIFVQMIESEIYKNDKEAAKSKEEEN